MGMTDAFGSAIGAAGDMTADAGDIAMRGIIGGLMAESYGDINEREAADPAIKSMEQIPGVIEYGNRRVTALDRSEQDRRRKSQGAQLQGFDKTVEDQRRGVDAGAGVEAGHPLAKIAMRSRSSILERQSTDRDEDDARWRQSGIDITAGFDEAQESFSLNTAQKNQQRTTAIYNDLDQKVAAIDTDPALRTLSGPMKQQYKDILARDAVAATMNVNAESSRQATLQLAGMKQYATTEIAKHDQAEAISKQQRDAGYRQENLKVDTNVLESWKADDQMNFDIVSRQQLNARQGAMDRAIAIETVANHARSLYANLRLGVREVASVFTGIAMEYGNTDFQNKLQGIVNAKNT